MICIGSIVNGLLTTVLSKDSVCLAITEALLFFYPWDFTFILYIRGMKSTFSSSHQILDRSQIHNKIMRLAYQIWEDHHEEEVIHVLGVSKTGAILAKRTLCRP